jgi:hypothetical protein
MPDAIPAAPPKPWPYPGTVPQRFSSTYAKYLARGGLIDVVEDARAYVGDGPMQDVERFMFLSLAFDQIHKEGLAGDIAELGVYKGQTAAVLARNARRLGRTAWLMDTFAGFDPKDFSGPDAGRAVQFEDTSLAAVRARVGEANTRFIAGFFPDTAVQLPPDGQYCLVHIDCDLYAPIMSGLEYFYPRMVPGGFLIVHDYGSLGWDGAEKAVDVFFADKPEPLVPMPDSAGSVLIRRQRLPGQGWLQSRQSVAVGEWQPAANAALVHLLDEGWSRPEAWGIWGVGAAHAISLAPADPALAAFDLDLDLQASLLPGRARQTVEVTVGGRAVGTWVFTLEANRGVRTLRVAAGDRRGPQPVTIVLRPSSVLSPHQIDPAKADTRPLGVALHRLRLRPPDAR